MSSTPRVAFFCPLWARGGPLRLGWSDYWRLALPAAELHRNGWDVVIGRQIGPVDGGRLSVMDPNGDWWGDRDVLVFSRWMGKYAPELIHNAVEAGQVLVNDLDDHFWAFPEGHPAIEAMDPDREPNYNVENYTETFPVSSLITTSTPRLWDVAQSFGVPVRVVPNYVDVRAWPQRAPGEYVGWVGSTAGRSADLAILRESVVPWLRERGLPFYHGGAVPGEPRMVDVLGYPNVIVRPTLDPGTYPRLWDPLRVALCPLGDTEFAAAKSWVKPLEACARGIPFIASDCWEYRKLLGLGGRVVSSPESWGAALDRFMEAGAAERYTRGLRRRAERFSIANRWEHWAEVLKLAVSLTEERPVAV